MVGLTINKISQVFRNSFDSIIISAFIGLVCLAQYQNYYYIVSALTIVMNVIMTAVGAGIGNGIASESIKKIMRIIRNFYLNIAALLQFLQRVCCV